MNITANGVRFRFHNNFVKIKADAPPLFTFEGTGQDTVLAEVNFDGYRIIPIDDNSTPRTSLPTKG